MTALEREALLSACKAGLRYSAAKLAKVRLSRRWRRRHPFLEVIRVVIVLANLPKPPETSS